ncbi:RNA-binding protein [Williamsoniiplasma lucivorax]|uniref:RNA-binding protein n=2 Tax=Williamsoniiplasma lucivorax TaxID=209274 RepID=A0A2S5RDW8_9MOLU|nr:RNA-binding protein [Williamsoniiplasma lucivorax]
MKVMTNITTKNLRKDLFSKTLIDRQNLIRIVKTKDNQIIIDLDQKMSGRGAYMQKSYEAIIAVKKHNGLARSLKTKIDEAIYDKLLGLLDE